METAVREDVAGCYAKTKLGFENDYLVKETFWRMYFASFVRLINIVSNIYKSSFEFMAYKIIYIEIVNSY